MRDREGGGEKIKKEEMKKTIFEKKKEE